MKLHTTFRGLDRFQSARAQGALERCTGRLKRLLERPVTLRAVVEDSGAGYRVLIKLLDRDIELHGEHTDHDLQVAISASCDRIKTQLAKKRRRRSAGRHRNYPHAPPTGAA